MTGRGEEGILVPTPQRDEWLAARARSRLTREGYQRALHAIRSDSLTTVSVADSAGQQRQLEAVLCAHLAHRGSWAPTKSWFAELAAHSTRAALTLNAGSTQATAALLNELLPRAFADDHGQEIHGIPGLRARRCGSHWLLTHLGIADAVVRLVAHRVFDVPDSLFEIQSDQWWRLIDDPAAAHERDHFDWRHLPDGDWALLCSRLLRRPSLLDPCSLGATSVSTYTTDDDLCMEWTGPLETGHYMEIVLRANLDVTLDPYYDEVLYTEDNPNNTREVMYQFGTARLIVRRQPTSRRRSSSTNRDPAVL
ncbi:hypothetical protein [Nocardia sp. NPDC052566]|uniref:hypothetical protein n=1 Tax=Nocardia sp. NPDC052566 TaxID=3364330 RepID=UPI0037CA701B